MDDAEAQYLAEHCDFVEEVRAAIGRARVPEVLKDVFQETRGRVEGLTFEKRR
ncbi:MAG: hypothetical protein ACYC8T_23405 [Myxococcaceae bacterium]